MHDRWPLQDAKNRFSEVVNDAIARGPQWVSRHGQEAVVILSVKDYKKLVQPKEGLVDFFQRSPLKNVRLDLKRSADPARDVNL